MDELFFKRELRSFLDSEGRATKYPSKYRLKIILLFYLASKFEPGRRYTEREVNELLREWHVFEDWSMLRRELYDGRFLDREKDGAVYWLEDKQPVLADFKLE